MNVTHSIGNTQKTNRFALAVLAIVVWFLHRYNQTNKYLNVWERSSKDIAKFGVSDNVRGYISRDNRIHLRWRTWSIYIGKPWFIER